MINPLHAVEPLSYSDSYKHPNTNLLNTESPLNELLPPFLNWQPDILKQVQV